MPTTTQRPTQVEASIEIADQIRGAPCLHLLRGRSSPGIKWFRKRRALFASDLITIPLIIIERANYVTYCQHKFDMNSGEKSFETIILFCGINN